MDTKTNLGALREEGTEDILVQSLQHSTRALIGSFRDRTKSITQSVDDIIVLLRQGYDLSIAGDTADKFFGRKKILFIAIDGTESQDQQLDMLLFYAGAFAYGGELEFDKVGCKCGEVIKATELGNISAAIPLYEEDAFNITGRETETGTEIDTERLPSILMQFAEYYLAVKLLQDNHDLKVVILDRTLAGDVGHLIWSVGEFINENKCILQGLSTEYGIVSPLDLELVRILHPNTKLGIPTPRSQFIKYSAINTLLSTPDIPDYQILLNKMGAKNLRLGKLENDMALLNRKYSFLETESGMGIISINPGLGRYWERVFSATMKLAHHIFNPIEGQHPLIYEYPLELDIGRGETKKTKRWITSADLEYMTLVMIYALIRLAWERKILLIGLIKDTFASELTKVVIPILEEARKIKLASALPQFNSDKQLLQTYSVSEVQSIKAPWRTFEFDACFRTMVPVSNKNENFHLETNQANVEGAYKNVISGERMFVKSYVQLWQSENDPSVRSHVFSYDRPCYPDSDKAGELSLLHKDDNVIEEIQPMLYFDKDSGISHLVMDILCSMAKEVIPECLGHNYPLFLADKKAKYVLDQMRTTYLSVVAYEMANSEFDQQILYQARFRDFRSQVENSRRLRK